MSSRQVDLHPEAVAEAQAAAQWYRERSVSAADAFLTEQSLANSLTGPLFFHTIDLSIQQKTFQQVWSGETTQFT
jgi:hypothetical protein